MYDNRIFLLGIIYTIRAEWRERGEKDSGLDKEWKIRKPDGSLMTLKERDPNLHKLLTDPKYKIPTILPNGIYNPKKTNTDLNIYDVVIIGGGPSGIMTSYKLNQLDSDLKIAILEANSTTFKDYTSSGYRDVVNWLKASYDTRFNSVITSKDEIPRAITIGSGLGGGTLHFGLQYIDQIDVLSKSNKEFQSDEYKRILTDISNIVQANRYDYSNTNFPVPLKQLKHDLSNNNLNFIMKTIKFIVKTCIIVFY